MYISAVEFPVSEEIQKHFMDYIINDTLGAISIAHLICAGHNLLKARSPDFLPLAALLSMAGDFAKRGAPAEMPRHCDPASSLTSWSREANAHQATSRTSCCT